jgi:hypothetical protein
MRYDWRPREKEGAGLLLQLQRREVLQQRSNMYPTS